MGSETVTSPLLRAQGVSAGYSSEAVLRRVDLALREGETVAVLGRSGSGKSTLLKALALMVSLKEGRIEFDGQCVADAAGSRVIEWEYRRKVSMVPQMPSLLPHLTLEGNLRLALEAVAGCDAWSSRKRSRTIVESFGLSGLETRYPEELSGGQMQRCQLARAAVLQPRVLLLDEVTSSVDPQTTLEVMGALRRLKRLVDGSTQTMVLVTHHVAFAQEFADRLLLLEDGCIRKDILASALGEGEREGAPELQRFMSTTSLDTAEELKSLDGRLDDSVSRV